MAKNKAMAFTGNRSISSIGISFLRYKKDCVVQLTVAKKQLNFDWYKFKNMFYNLFLLFFDFGRTFLYTEVVCKCHIYSFICFIVCRLKKNIKILLFCRFEHSVIQFFSDNAFCVYKCNSFLPKKLRFQILMNIISFYCCDRIFIEKKQICRAFKIFSFRLLFISLCFI